MNKTSLSHQSLTAAAENLKEDFMFLVRTAVCEEDLQVIKDAFDKAFATVPLASSLPSVKQEEEQNKAFLDAEIKSFFGSMKKTKLRK